jgi:hypothetical protein
LYENPKEKNLFEHIDTNKLCFNHFARHLVYDTLSESILYSEKNDIKVRQWIENGQSIKMKYVTEDNVRYIISYYVRYRGGCGGFTPLVPCICSEYLTPAAMMVLQMAMNKRTVIIYTKNTDKAILHKKMVAFIDAEIESGKADISFNLLSNLGISLEYFMSLL